MTISPAVNGLIKGVVIVAIAAVASYFADSANLTGIVGPTLATLVAAIASAIESHIKEKTGRGTFGAVAVR